MGLYLHAYTCYSSVRPFGAQAIVGLVDKNGPQLYMFEPSGVYWGYRACASGRAKTFAKTEIEKLDLSELTCRVAVDEITRILYLCHQEAKDSKDFEVEVSWICGESGGQHQLVPETILAASEEKAKQALLAAMDYE